MGTVWEVGKTVAALLETMRADGVDISRVVWRLSQEAFCQYKDAMEEMYGEKRTIPEWVDHLRAGKCLIYGRPIELSDDYGVSVGFRYSTKTS